MYRGFIAALFEGTLLSVITGLDRGEPVMRRELHAGNIAKLPELLQRKT
jgi:hypothetical protein